MLMTMTHHDGGMRVMTAVKRGSVREWSKERHQHKTAQRPRHILWRSDAAWCRTV